MRTDAVITIVGAHGARTAASGLTIPAPDGSCRGQEPGPACSDDTMKASNAGTAPPKPPVPPMPSEVTNAHTRAQRRAAGLFRTAMSPLRKLMHRALRHA
jgi:hypothetical protein